LYISPYSLGIILKLEVKFQYIVVHDPKLEYMYIFFLIKQIPFVISQKGIVFNPHTKYLHRQESIKIIIVEPMKPLMFIKPQHLISVIMVRHR